jgi:beta-galactosidase GanA
MFRLPSWIVSLFAGLALTSVVQAAAPDSTLPRIITENGRHALIVDGAPFVILGGQCHNSSAWPATLPQVWETIAAMHANTLEVPISWEQFEPEPGRFDYAIVDLLLQQARERHVRLVLLWFGTWKNGSAHYLPLWLKTGPDRYARIVDRAGRAVDSPSPHSSTQLAADTRAFTALMQHLKQADPQHTVIMVQVENEPGAWNAVRDFSPEAQKLFAAPVPDVLLNRLGLGAHRGEAWAAVFGANADEYFHAWSVAHFIGQVAAAGKAVHPLPLYVNAALRDPLTNPPAGTYESGGPTDNVLDIWKAAAPAIDLLAPDIYLPEPAKYQKVLELYARPDNPLFVPETVSAPVFSKYCYAALARGAIGWSPFGIDSPRRRAPAPADANEPDALAVTYAAISPSNREVARLAFAGKLHALVEEKGELTQSLILGRWQVTVTYGVPAFGFGRDPKGNPEPVGRALIGELGPDEFLVTAYQCRVDFQPADTTGKAQREYVRVEEGAFEPAGFKAGRIWNGDETDWGLNFHTSPQMLRVRLGTF